MFCPQLDFKAANGRCAEEVSCLFNQSLIRFYLWLSVLTKFSKLFSNLKFCEDNDKTSLEKKRRFQSVTNFSSVSIIVIKEMHQE